MDRLDATEKFTAARTDRGLPWAGVADNAGLRKEWAIVAQPGEDGARQRAGGRGGGSSLARRWTNASG